MSYDVFLVAALEDRDMAKLVTRRLRGLKMRVWYDAKSTDDVFDAKESRAIDRSKSMIVLWSENAVKSSFVRAAAGQGYSKIEQGYPFIQAGLDDAVPYDPYSVDDLHGLKGFTSRTNTDGWFEIIDKLEAHQGRKGLRDWLLIPTKDKDTQDAWRKDHPKDPLAKKGQPVGVKSTATTGAAAAAATGAAASLAAAKPETTEPATETAPAPEPDPVKVVRTAPAASTAKAAQTAESGGDAIVWAMLGAVALLFLFAFFARSGQVTPSAAALPGVANTVFTTCPAGTIPREMLVEDILQPGPIINDTE